MSTVTISNIIGKINNRKTEVEKAYEIACDIHKNQFRESGEPYIIHPLNVANNLLEMEIYDPDTISAALLHDTIEDAEEKFTKEDIAELINPTVAELVDGVTKISRINFSSKNDQNYANTRKIINGLNKDVRIILIKLADRRHNMETLQFKKPEKQVANAQETMELFVPLALNLGAYKVKNILEDLSLKYINPSDYQRIEEMRAEIEERERPYLELMAGVITRKLSNDIGSTAIHEARNLTINTIYKKMNKDGMKIENIDDICYFKIIVPEKKDCYTAVGITHELYRPFPGTLRDYIGNPRDNYYQSIHTRVVDANGKLRKIKIRTEEMNKIAAYGISARWNIKEGENKATIEESQQYIRDKFFSKKLKEFDKSAIDDEEFIQEIYTELLTDHIYVYTEAGHPIELPEGATALDFAIQVHPELIDKISGILVNGIEVKLNQKLKNDDRVRIITNDLSSDNYIWENYAYMPSTKRKIKKYNEKNLNRQNN